ncbi:polysaccharide biosynthesis/export family protein [Desulfospira joergensenii]|uniref:polysaccharide biosynthesis/export family protein n=1 Tax=Desulfospira joergensenii TaxID=53329 RepID=UPI0003B6C711|nr:polysaccharide biosynthesis/export family protein [Desulfospira joergensenii]
MFGLNKIKYFIMLLIINLSVLFLIDTGFSEDKASNSNDYKIGVGDVLKVSTWKEQDLSFEALIVRNDGKITFPLLDDLRAEGKTTVELKNTIQEKLADFVEAPTVTITLVNPTSQKYYILGEVMNVGEYPLIKKLTVVQAFALAKGFTEWAAKDEIILFRRHHGKEKMIKIDYDDITDGNLKNDIQLRADDIIIVP